MKDIKVNFFVLTGYVGAEKEQERIISVPDDYNCEDDEDNLIQDEFEDWFWENIDSGWRIIK